MYHSPNQLNGTTAEPTGALSPSNNYLHLYLGCFDAALVGCPLIGYRSDIGGMSVFNSFETLPSTLFLLFFPSLSIASEHVVPALRACLWLIAQRVMKEMVNSLCYQVGREVGNLVE